MKKILTLTAFFIFLFTYNPLSAQDKIYKDKVILKQGNVMIGAITDYVPGEYLAMELKTGNNLRFTDKQIKRVIMHQGGLGNGSSGEVFVPVRKNRLYNETDFSILTGPSSVGVSLSHNVLFQYTQRLSLGGGVGIDNYKVEPGKSIFPLYANAKYYLLNGTSAPYVGMKMGYGFGFTNEDANITEASGGYMASPYFGLRLGSRGTMINLFSGLKIQKADYVITRSWETRREDILYRRVILGMSVMF